MHVVTELQRLPTFSFNVILFTFLESLIPSNMGANVFPGQFFRYFRICSHVHYAIEKVKSTYEVFVSRVYLRKRMQYLLQKLIFVLFKFGLHSAKQLSLMCYFY